MKNNICEYVHCYINFWVENSPRQRGQKKHFFRESKALTRSCQLTCKMHRTLIICDCPSDFCW